ncbi:MAG: galactokinase [Cellulosilyticaceae bacterium]
MNIEYLKSIFIKQYGDEAEAVYFAPGRINLIGEHIDYNGGLVFPAAITLGTYAVVKKREDRQINAYSLNFEELGIISFDLDNLEYNEGHNWVNYIKGVAKCLSEENKALTHGFDIVVFGNIPNGSGLSSSASLEMLIVTIFNEYFKWQMTPVEKAILGKKVENNYIGVQSGIMDQFAIALGQKNSALLLNCETLEYNYFPIVLKGYKIIIMNTNKRRELADSKYNERREECENALSKLKKVLSVTNLCEVTTDMLQMHKTLLTDIEYKRVRHVVTENERVIASTEALKVGDLATFGDKLNASHTSLCKDYEVTGIELDTLVSAAWEEKGVVGARMTGAGFGGCSLAIVEEAEVSKFIENVGAKYLEVVGYEASFYIAEIGDGPIKL